MDKVVHKEVKLKSSVYKLKGYSDENYWSITKSKEKDTFITNVAIKSGSSVKINVLYEGDPKQTPIDLLEDLLCVSDSSENPLRPFRWYRGNAGICVDTNDPEDIKRGRNESLNLILKEIDNPAKIWIYEIE